MGHFSPLGGEGGRAEQALVLQVRLLDAHLGNKPHDKTNTMTNLQVVLLLNFVLEHSSTEYAVPGLGRRSLFFILVLVSLLLFLQSLLVKLAHDGEQLHIEVLLCPLDLLFPHVDWEIPGRAKGKNMSLKK